jgi:hypothetical protein
MAGDWSGLKKLLVIMGLAIAAWAVVIIFVLVVGYGVYYA